MAAFDYLNVFFLLSVIPWTVFVLWSYVRNAFWRVLRAVRAIVILAYLWPVAIIFFLACRANLPQSDSHKKN